jgi:DNA (cytosine-5)-methyltransferase 1
MDYYNEIDDFAANWLQGLIDEGHINQGIIDRRSIEDVTPNDIRGFRQCHFFAGIGIWPLAIRNAGWGDRPGLWSGSCPCQPFSAAGKGAGFDDERHLWPAWFHLVSVCRPDIIFGEQVASKDGLTWLDLVWSDLEGSQYAFGPLDSCAAGFGAPHIRQRLYFSALSLSLGVGDGERSRLEGYTGDEDDTTRRKITARSASKASCPSRLADHESVGSRTGLRDSGSPEQRRNFDSDGRAAGGLDDAYRRSISQPFGQTEGRDGERSNREDFGSGSGRPGPTNGFWGIADWLRCRDDKWRPVESGTLPLAHGVAARMGLLRAYGNAIVEPQAREHVRAVRQFVELIESGI